MKGKSSSLQISLSVYAVSSAIWRDSTTHGPAIRNRGLSRPASNPHSFMLSSRDRGLGLAGLVLQRGLDERRKERMPAAGRRSEFRMEPAADEPGVRRQLDHLAQLLALGEAGNAQALVLQSLHVLVVDLVAVAVAFVDHVRAVDLARQLDHRELHAQADAEIRDLVLARVLDRLHHAFDAPLAEAPGDEYRVHAFQERADAVLLDRLRIHVTDVDPAARVDPGVDERLVERLV